MRLQSVTLRDFRNHASTSIECSTSRNVFVGRNGEGKTNILEAISYLCFGRSFYAASDSVALRLGAEKFRVAGEFRSDRDVAFVVEVEYDPTQGGRKLRIGGADVPKRSEMIGLFPVVVLSPEFAPITTGGPADRRRMIDTTLSQSGKRYVEDLIEYRKALRHRNALLTEARQRRRLDAVSLSSWTEILVERGSRITDRRRRFIEEFQPYVTQSVSALSGRQEVPELMYESSVTAGEETRKAFAQQLERVGEDELGAGITLVGPHRDELDLRINGLSLRQYASQGQHKTFLVGLKLAEFLFLKETCGETPVLLLDDVFSELDPERNARVLGLTGSAGQAFITVADERLLPRDDEPSSTVFSVQAGRVRRTRHAEQNI